MAEKFDIDFVVTWVNGRDKNWLKKYNHYSSQDTLDEKDARFRDFYIFRYWFRAVEKFAPWVHHVYLVTDEQIPSWLDVANPMITVVDHREIIDSKFLPIFNSSAIELNLHKIPGLAEHFVYFNDDMFLNRKTQPADFFSKQGLPKDTAGLNAIQPMYDFDYIHENNIRIINQNFNKKDVMRKQFFKFINPVNLELNIYTILLFFWPKFTRFFDLHYPYSILKSQMSQVIKKNKDAYLRTMNDRFRSKNDVTIWLVRYYALVQGKFSVRTPRVGKIYDLYTKSREAEKDIEYGKHKMIVINDNSKIDDTMFLEISEILREKLKERYFDKSSFEK
ncbi:sugar phosphotransferase [Levilactobacillus suantsaiihabitans]|uniref:Sugar phosphotransferase n=1 Tax=Levilactobacillus suantsaiihabitans TaxID=2487722 RepID=A0A4Z0J7Q0_9LACO|nr:sugar phosphotransferase [Levilactobacillus suantsaiihabitans]